LGPAELRPSSLQLATALAAAEAELVDERAAKADLKAQLYERFAALEDEKRGLDRRLDEAQKKQNHDAST